MIENEKEMVIKIAKRRYQQHKERTTQLGLQPPKEDDFVNTMIESLQSGFVCPYCKRKLNLYDPYPYKLRPSIDHKIPLTMSGSSKKENLIVCCCSCNLLKGTMNAETYLELVEKVGGADSKLFKKIENESFNGKLADKVHRTKIETTTKKNGRVIKCTWGGIPPITITLNENEDNTFNISFNGRYLSAPRVEVASILANMQDDFQKIMNELNVQIVR